MENLRKLRNFARRIRVNWLRVRVIGRMAREQKCAVERVIGKVAREQKRAM